MSVQRHNNTSIAVLEEKLNDSDVSVNVARSNPAE